MGVVTAITSSFLVINFTFAQFDLINLNLNNERGKIMNIYVGNLSHDVDDTDLRIAFTKYGEVSSVEIAKDVYSGKPRGFAFVEMPNKSEAETAIKNLNGKALKGQTLKIEARPKSEDRLDEKEDKQYKGGW